MVVLIICVICCYLISVLQSLFAQITEWLNCCSVLVLSWNHKQPFAITSENDSISPQDCVQPMMCSGSETPEALTSKLQHCMLEGQIM